MFKGISLDEQVIDAKPKKTIKAAPIPNKRFIVMLFLWIDDK